MIKMLLHCFMFIMLSSQVAYAQLTENFNDGDFTANPVWSGNMADFIVSSSLQLQTNSTVANSNYFLSTPNTLSNIAEWDMYIQINCLLYTSPSPRDRQKSRMP